MHPDASPNPKLKKLNASFFNSFERVIKEEWQYNQWFTEENVRKAIGAISASLSRASLEKWLSSYPELPVHHNSSKTVGVVMAGNIPLVGFHDMVSVVMAGHRFLGKPSSKDDRLIKIVAELLQFIEPELNERIRFTDNYLKEADAIIATGSNNTSRYFDYYFKNKPHIIRKNRNGVAILTGMETEEELLALGSDITSYFGLGCRNVTKLFIPEAYDLINFMRIMESFNSLSEHTKYMNNIDYNRAMYLMNLIPFLDNGVLLLKEDAQIASPVGVVFYEKYSHLESVIKILNNNSDLIQCIVSRPGIEERNVLPGQTQSPALWDYADGIDTMKFLSDLV